MSLVQGARGLGTEPVGSGAGFRTAPVGVRGRSPRKSFMVLSVSLLICNERKQGKNNDKNINY